MRARFQVALGLLLGLYLVLAGLVLSQSQAQTKKPADFGIKSKKALKLYQKGQDAERYREWARAYDYYMLALKEEAEFGAAQLGVGVAAFQMLRPAEAEQYLTKAQASERNQPSWQTTFYLGQLYQQQGRFDQAAEQYTLFGQAKGPKPMAEMKTVEDNLPRMRFAAELMRNPVQFTPINLGENINSPGHEYVPFITADNSRMFFTSRRKGNLGGYDPLMGDFNEDFYVAERLADGSWGEAENLGPPVNTEGSEGTATFSADGQWVFFTACQRQGGLGSCDLYFARNDGNTWTKPVNAGAAINSRFWESYPCLSPDGRTLYFASDRPGGKGGSDIWVSTLGPEGWLPAQPLPGPFNTPGDESAPFLHADGQTFYFSSSGHLGLGKMDLFLARLNPDSTWSEPENLGYPLNTVGDDRTIFVNTEGTMGYLNSDREGGLGGIDIYAFELDDRIRPRPATWVRGVVLDSLSRQPIGRAQIVFVDLATGDTARQLLTADQTGAFKLSLPLGRDYAAYVDHKGYLFNSRNFSLKNLGGNTQYYDLTIVLSKIKADEVIRLDNIFFAFDQATLLPESNVELEKLLAFLKQNSRLKTELGGHTDDRGTEAYNLKLSLQRAEAVRNWLVERGIAPDRISARGYGLHKPLAPNTTDEGRALNRRTELKIIGE